MLIMAATSFPLSALCIDRWTPEYMKGCSGFGHAFMCSFGAAATAFAVACTNALLFGLNKKRQGGFIATLLRYVIAAAVSFVLVTVLAFWYYWQHHHGAGHVCHTWSP